jgi:hypothetical protein
MVKSEDFALSPVDAHVRSVRMDGSFFKGCMFGEVCWITKPFTRDSFFRHRSDELLVFIGGDVGDPEHLNAEVELWIENDKLTLTQTSIVFVPAGAAHGRVTVKNVKKPFLHYTCHLNTDTYEEIPAEASAPKGTYAGNWVEKYAPVDGKLPAAPEGFLTLLLWIDGKKLKGAPYMEAVWFKTKNDTGPRPTPMISTSSSALSAPTRSIRRILGAEVQFYIGDEFFYRDEKLPRLHPTRRQAQPHPRPEDVAPAHPFLRRQRRGLQKGRQRQVLKSHTKGSVIMPNQSPI